MKRTFPRLLLFELRVSLRQVATWGVLVPLTLALLAAAWMGAGRVAGQRANIADARAEEVRVERDALAAHIRFSKPSPLKIDFYRDPTGPYSYMTMFLVRSLVQAPSPLAALAIGQSDVAPQRIRLTFGFSAMFTDDFADIGSPRLLKRGGFDPAFVLVYLLPLAIIALGATRLAGEQETGILRMIAAQPVRIRTVAAAKFGALTILFVGWLAVAGAGALAVAGIAPLPAGWGMPLIWLNGVLCTYILFWVLVCVLAASLWRGSSAAVATAVAVWAAVTILLPSAAALATDQRVPVPSRIAYIDVSRRAMAHYYEDGDAMAAAFARANPLLAHRPDLAKSTEVKRLARDAYNAQVLAAPRRRLDERRERAATLADRLALLSPALAVQRTLERAAGSDALRDVRFQQTVDGFNRRVRRFFGPRILADVIERRRPCADCPAQLTFDAYEKVPRFGPMASFSDPIAAAGQALLMLGGLISAMLILARRRFRDDHLMV